MVHFVMKLILTAFISLTTLVCAGQVEYELADKADAALSNGQYDQALDLYDKVIDIAADFNLDGYFYGRAQAKFNLRDFGGAMEDVTESLNRRNNFCGAIVLRGYLKLKLDDRSGACTDWEQAYELCKYYETALSIKTHCNPDWDYEKVHKVHVSDTTYCASYIEAYYHGCQKKVVDTSYTLNYRLELKGDWEAFYDHGFTLKFTDLFTRNDTVFRIDYYRSGRKKKEERTFDDIWIYNAEWCENGQQTYVGNPNNLNYDTYVTYHCNGKMSWQGALWNAQSWGVHTRWYEHGKKKSVNQYTEFNQNLADQGKLKNELLSSRYWDANRKELDNPPAALSQVVMINTIGAPMFTLNELDKIKAEKWDIVDYSSVAGHPEYDKHMTMFKEKVYSLATPPENCKCKAGQSYIDFIVDTEGTINDISVSTSLEENVDAAFIVAIKKIGKWKPVSFKGKPVQVVVRVALELERVNGA